MRQAQRPRKGASCRSARCQQGRRRGSKGQTYRTQDDLCHRNSRIVPPTDNTRFCIDEKEDHLFRVDFRDKEQRPIEYGLIQINGLRLSTYRLQLSDEKGGRRRSEVYMLDLSHSQDNAEEEAKGYRLRCAILFKGNRNNGAKQKWQHSKQRLGLLRRGPYFISTPCLTSRK